MHPIFERLKERKIVQWALAYAAGAGVLYSTLDGPLRIWGITDGQLKIVQVLLVVGCFLAITLAWYHGERGEQRVTGVELLILAGIMGLGAIGLRLVGPGPIPVVPPGQRVDRLPNPFLPEDQSIFPGPGSFELSPDGSFLVFEHAREGRDRRLWLRDWDNLAATPIRETEGGRRPTVSPDGASIAFERSGELFWLDLAGGPTSGPVHGTWPHWGEAEDIYATGEAGNLVLIPSGGGATEPITDLGPGELEHRMTDLLPDGRSSLITVFGEEGAARMEVLNLRSGSRTPLIEGESARYLPPDHVLYSVDATVMAAQFDAGRSEITGDPVAVIDTVRAWTVADDRSLFYSTGLSGSVDVGTINRVVQLLWVSRHGDVEPIDDNWFIQFGSDNGNWAVSPDGSLIAYRERLEGQNNIWTRRLSDGLSLPLTTDGGGVVSWGPGVGEVSFRRSVGDGVFRLWKRRVDRLQDAELMYEGDLYKVAWSPSGDWLVIRTNGLSNQPGRRDILAVRMADTAIYPISANPDFDEFSPQISPNGRYIAYVSTVSGIEQIEVRPFPPSSTQVGLWTISSDGGSAPRWSNDGNELYYQTPRHELVAVPVKTDGQFEYGEPEVLFERRADWLRLHATLPGGVSEFWYEVGPEGLFTVARLIDAGYPEGVPETVLIKNIQITLEGRFED